MSHQAILLFFSVAAMLFGSVAALATSIKRSILFLWLCGLMLGACYLTIGAEFMAVVQWILSTLLYHTFVFYSQMFRGDYRTPDWVKLGLSTVISTVMLTGVYFGLRDAPLTFESQRDGQSLSMIGNYLLSDQLISIELISLSLFLVIVGVGVLGKRQGDHD